MNYRCIWTFAAALLAGTAGPLAQAATTGYWRAEADQDPSGDLYVDNEVSGGFGLSANTATVDSNNVPVTFIPQTGEANTGSFNGDAGLIGLNGTVGAYAGLNSDSITVEFWARSQEGGGNFVHRTDNASSGFTITGFRAMEVTYYVQDASGGTTPVHIQTDVGVSGIEWDHIAWTYDQTSGIGRLYRNGTEIGATAAGSETPGQALSWSGAGNLIVGHQMDGGAAYSSNSDGYFDELRISDTALNSHQFLAAPGLAVDFGADAQDQQVYFQTISAPGEGSAGQSVVNETLESVLGTNGTVNVRVTPDGSGAVDFRDRGDTSDDLGNLLEDHIKNQIGGLTLELTGLAAGTYMMTTYHHEGQNGEQAGGASNQFDILVSDALGTDRLVSDDLATSFGTGDVDPTTGEFLILSDGINPITVTFEALGIGGDNPYETNLNGFTLVQTQSTVVPEPATLGVLGIGTLALMRRRRS